MATYQEEDLLEKRSFFTWHTSVKISLKHLEPLQNFILLHCLQSKSSSSYNTASSKN